jgi:hypothetical protein
MKRIGFCWSDPEQKLLWLWKPITRLSLRRAAHGLPISITMWNVDRLGLKIFPVMHDIDDRQEVGVLNFDLVSSVEDTEEFVDSPSFLLDKFDIMKLIIQLENIEYESGLEFSQGNVSVTIVPGSFPLSLAIRGAPQWDAKFDPEYDLASYSREPY